MHKPETTTKKPQPVVTVHIVPGEVTAYEKKLWQAVWRRLLATVQSELRAESEDKQ